VAEWTAVLAVMIALAVVREVGAIIRAFVAFKVLKVTAGRRSAAADVKVLELRLDARAFCVTALTAAPPTPVAAPAPPTPAAAAPPTPPIPGAGV